MHIVSFKFCVVLYFIMNIIVFGGEYIVIKKILTGKYSFLIRFLKTEWIIVMNIRMMRNPGWILSVSCLFLLSCFDYFWGFVLWIRKDESIRIKLLFETLIYCVELYQSINETSCILIKQRNEIVSC